RTSGKSAHRESERLIFVPAAEIGDHGRAGHPFSDPRPIVNGILWILHTGAPWRDLPDRYGPWETVFASFNHWREDGTWVRIATLLLDELDDRGQIDHDLWCIDGTVIRASRA